MAINIPANINLQVSGRRPLGQLTGDLKMFDSALQASNARVLAFGASTAIIYNVQKAFKQLAQTTIDVQRAMVDINRILGASTGTLNKVGNELFGIAKNTATSFKDTSSAFLEFSRQGLGAEEALKRTSDALKLVRLTGMDAKKTVDLLTATVNAFSDIDTTTAIDKFVAVETRFAVSAKDLVEGLSRVGSAAQDAKVNFDELNGLIASVQQTTGRGGAVIGNAFKTIFTRLQRTETLDALENFNVAVRDSKGNILPATKVLQNFSGAYRDLGDSTKAYLREQVAGVFQGNILSAILKDLNKEESTFAKALQVSALAANNAAIANERLNNSLSAILTKTSTGITELQSNIGKLTLEPFGKTFLPFITDGLSELNNLLKSDSEKFGADFAKGVVRGFGSLIGPGLIAAFAVFGKVAFNLGKDVFTKLLPALLKIETSTSRRLAEEQQILGVIRQQIGAYGGQVSRRNRNFVAPTGRPQDIAASSQNMRTTNTQNAIAEQRYQQDIARRISLGGIGAVGSRTGFQTGFGNVAGSLAGLGRLQGNDLQEVLRQANNYSMALATGTRNQNQVNEGLRGLAADYNTNYSMLVGQVNRASRIDLSRIVSRANENFGNISLAASNMALSLHAGTMTMDQVRAETRALTTNMGISAAQAGRLAVRIEQASAQIAAGVTGNITGTLGRFNALLSGPGIAAATSIGLPILGGLAYQEMEGGTNRTQKTYGKRFTEEATQSVTSYAGIGAGIGALVGNPLAGAAIGGLVGLAEAAFKASLSVEELDQSLTDFENSTKENIQLVESFLSQRESYLSADTASARDKIQKDMLETFRKIKDSDLPEYFKYSSITIEQLTNSLKRYQNESLKSVNIRALRGRAEGFERKGSRLRAAQAKTADTRSGGNPNKIEFVTEKFFDQKTFEEAGARFGDFLSIFADSTGKFTAESRRTLENAFEESGTDFQKFGKILAEKNIIEESDILDLERGLEAIGYRDFAEIVKNATYIFKQYQDQLKKLTEEAPTPEDLTVTLTSIRKNLQSVAKTQGIKSLGSQIRASYTETISSLQQEIANDLKEGRSGAVSRSFGDQIRVSNLKAEQQKIDFALKNIDQIQKLYKETAIQTNESNQVLRDSLNSFMESPETGLASLKSAISEGLITGDNLEQFTNLIDTLSQDRASQLANLQYEQTVINARKEVELQRAKNTEEIERLTTQQKVSELQLNTGLIQRNLPRQLNLQNLRSELDLMRTQTGLTTGARFSRTQEIESQIFEETKAIEKDRQRVELQLFDNRKSLELNTLKVEQELAKAKIKSEEILRSGLMQLDTTIRLLTAQITAEQQIPFLSIPEVEKKYEKELADAANVAGVNETRSLRGYPDLPLDVKNNIVQAAEDTARQSKLAELNLKERKATIQNRKDLVGVLTQDIKGNTTSVAGGASAGAIGNYLSNSSQTIDRMEQVTKAERENIEARNKQIDAQAVNERRIRMGLSQADYEQKTGKGSFGRGMDEGFAKITDDVDTFRFTLGEQIPNLFASNMTNALNQAMDGAEDLGDALRGAAIGFLTEIRNQLTANAVKGLMSGVSGSFGSDYTGIRAGKQRGGFIHAQNGMYISGSRYGDRNPALLEDGEYVLNRNAVRALGGPGSIDQLNFGMAPRFQSGGSAFINEKIGSSRLSGLFYASDNPELQEARDAARARYEEMQRKKAERKALRNAFISTLAMGAFSGLTGYIQDQGGLGEIFGKKEKTADGFTLDKKTSTGMPKWALKNQSGGYISSGARNMDSIPAFMAGGEFVMNNKAVRKYGLGFMSRLNGGYIPAYQSGGSVAESPASTLGAMSGGNTNNINISINMGNGGSGSGEQSSSKSGNDQTGGDQSSNAEELSKRIEAAVVKVIQKEQRVGGLLSESGRKNN